MTSLSSAPTILDVAARAGVSKSLVSRVVSGNGSVSAAAREKVMTAVRELGYTTNTQARGLVSGRSGVVGVLLRSSIAPFYGELFRQLQATAERDGFRFVAATGNLDVESEESALETLISLRVDGIVVGSGRLPSAAIAPSAEKIPTVVVGRGAGSARADVVRYDAAKAAGSVIQQLVNEGHRSAVVLTFPESLSSRPRVEGLRRAAARLGVELFEVLGHFDYEPARSVMERLLADGRQPTAVITLAGGAGHAVCDALELAGLSVPEAVSVVCMDTGVPDPALRWQLSGCRQDIAALAEATWAQLRDRMQEPGDPLRKRLVAPIEVAGSTLGPLR